MTKFLSAFLVVLSTQSTIAQNGAPEPVLMTVDGQPVTRAEFEAIYKKNNKEAKVDRAALDEYLELFINYKLKVREAEKEGMDTVPKFTDELDGYRKQLARPYLIDRELNDALIREAYDRMQQEVRASHILVQLAAEAVGEDTLAAWKRITSLRDRVMQGEDFGAAARGAGGSDDPSAAKNGGDLGWFSALQMVYPFETAAYNTPVGQVSQPVRTRFGYHIVKVAAKRPARGQVRVAHIMLRSSEQDTPEQRQQVERNIRDIHQRILRGEMSFGDAALRYSEDESSNAKGGELPQFGTGKMIEEFEDAAFAMKADGEIGEPVSTRYGWHIIRRLDHQPPPTFDQAKGDLKTRIGKDSRAEITRKAFVDKLKKEYGVKVFPENLKPLYALVDSTIFKKGTAVNDTLLRRNVVTGPYQQGKVRYSREVAGMLKDRRLVSVNSKQYEELPQTQDDTLVVRNIMEGWAYDRKKAAKLTKPLLVIKDRTWTQRDLLNELEEKQRREKVVPIKEMVNIRFDQFVEETILNFEDGQLEAKYPDFRMLMKEYRDGILLFELTDRMVWGKAVKDTAGLEAFHQAHRDQFMWDTRYEADLYACNDAAVAKQVRTHYKKGKRGSDLTDVVNKTDPLALEFDGGTWTVEQKGFLGDVAKTGLSADLPVDGRVMIVDLKRIIPPTPKELDEARGAVTAAYQDSLEKAWVQELRAKYPVVVNKDVLYSIQ